MDRPQLQAMLDYVREGDVVVVSDFSKLARSTKDMLIIVQELTNKGVGLISLKEQVYTDTLQGRFMLPYLRHWQNLKEKLSYKGRVKVSLSQSNKANTVDAPLSPSMKLNLKLSSKNGATANRPPLQP